MSVKFTDNSNALSNALENAKTRALNAIGATAEGYAKDICPVDTGRLRNSISCKQSGDSVYIGTNVEYAPFVEFGSSKRKPKPYLRPAATEHTDEYRRLAKESMENA